MRHTKIERWTMLLGITVLAGMVLFANEMRILREQIAEAVHDTEVNDIRAGLMEVWVKRQVHHQSWDVSTLQHVNPLRLVTHLPQNYLGEFEQHPVGKQQVWFYDVHRECLIYVFANQKQVGYSLKRLENAEAIGTVDGLDFARNERCN